MPGEPIGQGAVDDDRLVRLARERLSAYGKAGVLSARSRRAVRFVAGLDGSPRSSREIRRVPTSGLATTETIYVSMVAYNGLNDQEGRRWVYCTYQSQVVVVVPAVWHCAIVKNESAANKVPCNDSLNISDAFFFKEKGLQEISCSLYPSLPTRFINAREPPDSPTKVHRKPNRSLVQD